jgi:chemotaxis protein CheC
MLNSHIILSAPEIRFIDQEELVQVLGGDKKESFSAIQMKYRGSIDGLVELIFKTVDAGKLVDCIIGENTVAEEGLDSVRSGTLCETGNIVINAVLGTISNELHLDLEYTVPTYNEGSALILVDEKNTKDGQTILLIETRFLIETLDVTGNIVIFLSFVSLGQLKRAIASYLESPR